MSVTVVDFGKNDSAIYAHVLADYEITCPNGILARIQDEAPSEARQVINVETNDVVIFQRVCNCINNVACRNGASNLIHFKFDVKNNFIVIHDHCYKDFYKYATNTKAVEVFNKDSAGTWMYDEDMASFIQHDGSTAQKYDREIKQVPIQDSGSLFTAFIESPDIIFADFCVGDRPVEIMLAATISVAGLKLTYAVDTSTIFKDTNAYLKLGDESYTGSFDNEVVRYAGNRCIVSKKVHPTSRAGIAIRYRLTADFENNGFDDIEIHDMNLLTEEVMHEVSTDA
jgi:hypothetical protein